MSKREITSVIDITTVGRQEAYQMYIKGTINREEMYDYLHERMMWLLDTSESEKNDSLLD
jgi:S-ribosylhomocysteine lyase LuxS involved in autoinducer biosynthesis